MKLTKVLMDERQSVKSVRQQERYRGWGQGFVGGDSMSKGQGARTSMGLPPSSTSHFYKSS